MIGRNVGSAAPRLLVLAHKLQLQTTCTCCIPEQGGPPAGGGVRYEGRGVLYEVAGTGGFKYLALCARFDERAVGHACAHASRAAVNRCCALHEVKSHLPGDGSHGCWRHTCARLCSSQQARLQQLAGYVSLIPQDVPNMMQQEGLFASQRRVACVHDMDSISADAKVSRASRCMQSISCPPARGVKYHSHSVTPAIPSVWHRCQV